MWMLSYVEFCWAKLKLWDFKFYLNLFQYNRHPRFVNCWIVFKFCLEVPKTILHILTVILSMRYNFLSKQKNLSWIRKYFISCVRKNKIQVGWPLKLTLRKHIIDSIGSLLEIPCLILGVLIILLIWFGIVSPHPLCACCGMVKFLMSFLLSVVLDRVSSYLHICPCCALKDYFI